MWELSGLAKMKGVKAAVRFREDGFLLGRSPGFIDLDLETLDVMTSLCSLCRERGMACTDHREEVIAVCPIRGGEFLGIVCEPWLLGEIWRGNVKCIPLSALQAREDWI
jgi:hypothetical protein